MKLHDRQRIRSIRSYIKQHHTYGKNDHVLADHLGVSKQLVRNIRSSLMLANDAKKYK